MSEGGGDTSEEELQAVSSVLKEKHITDSRRKRNGDDSREKVERHRCRWPMMETYSKRKAEITGKV